MGLLEALKSGAPLTRGAIKTPLVSHEQGERLFAPSFVDLLPVKHCMGDGIFYFRDGGLGCLFQLEPINLEATTDEYKAQILEDIAFALQSTVPYEYDNFWLSQMFIVKEQSADEVMQKLTKHCVKHNQFSEFYLQTMSSHITSLSNVEGAFVDKNTGEPWSLSQLSIYFCVWQEKPPVKEEHLSKEFDDLKDLIVIIKHTFSQANIKLNSLGDQGYINLLSQFINNKAPSHHPNILEDEDLSEVAIKHVGISVGNGCFHFSKNGNSKYGIYMPVDKIHNLDRIRVGHLSAEQSNKLSLFDKLPVGSIWAQTTIHISPDRADKYLEKIGKQSMGNDEHSKNNGDRAEEARKKASDGDLVCRFAGGIYLFGKNQNKLLKDAKKVKSIFAAQGLSVLELKENPLAQDDFIRSMPMCFNYKFDRSFFAKRSSLQHLSIIAALSPFYGRSKGTGTPGVVKFNRGGEPLMFDPIQDKYQNAFGLLFGPSGTGKSAWLIEFLFSMMAIYNPKHVFVIEKGDSFGLFVDHCKQQGLSTNKVVIKASSGDVHLPPFANATRLITDQNIDKERDLLGELLIVAQLMITGGEEREIAKFERGDWDTVGDAIKLAAQNTIDDNREVTLTEDVVQALTELSKQDDLLDNEKERIRKMAKAMRVYISSDFNKRIFNTEGRLFPEVAITQLDVGLFATDGYESQLVVAFVSLMNDVNRLGESNQFGGHPIFVIIDEAHIFTKHPLIVSWILKMVKMWRKWGVWVWFATPSLKDYTDTAKSMFETIEWIVCLQVKKSEAKALSNLIDLSKEQNELMMSMKGSDGQYKEGVVFSQAINTLFRSVSMPLALALAMTEQKEKATRQKIMQNNNCSELEAAYLIAEQILESRKRVY